jgi:protoporphyrinogen oxidase
MSAAYTLVRAGAEVTVLERERRVGGLCGTQEYRSFRFDLGGHRFLTRSPALRATVEELLGEDLLLRRRSSVVLHRGHRYRYPLELDDVVRKTGLGRGARTLVSYAGERLRQRVRPQADRSFEDWVVHRFGRELYDTFFGPYTEKLWGIPPSQISADWASQRISLLSLADVCVRLLGLRLGGSRSYARRYLYPRMAEATAQLGGTLLLGTSVTGLETAHGRVHSVRFTDDHGTHEIECDAVISTVSLPLLARMLPARGSSVERAAHALRFRGIRLLNLLIDQPEVSPHTWMYVSEPRYLMARIQEPRHRSPFAAPPGKTSLMLEIPCGVGDEIWRAPQAAIYERCLADLAALGIRELPVIDHFSSFVSEGYPIYHLDYQSDRRTLLGSVARFENVVSCGRQGAFRYIFMDTAMEMGLAAAERILGRAGSGEAVAELRSERGLIESAAVTA